MTRTFVLLPVVAALSFCACAGDSAAEAAPHLTAAFAPANRFPGSSSALVQAASRTAAAVEGRLPLPSVRRRRAGRPAVSRVEAANQAATREPRRDAYVNAVQVYAWTEGAVYRLYTAPERVSEIALQPGETLISVAAGDTARWVIGDTTSGTGAGRRTHILVKPSAAGLGTNLVITTDRRVYHVQLESTVRTAMTSISWTYPADALLALRAGGGEVAVGGRVTLEALNFAYRIEGDDPPWRPIRAFDDGSQVFIEFPAGLGQGEAPPLFLVSKEGRTELVNYRVRGRYYVVDRLFAAAELRLGERRQQVVRISRRDAHEKRRPRGKQS